MSLQFTSAKEANCFCSSDASSEHASQPHIQLSILPSPDTPITISSFPIEIRSETSVFRPTKIANLWTQLLSIHIQNGNFWKQGDAAMHHRETTPAPALSRDELEQIEITKLEKGVMYLRYKLQKGLLSKDQQPIEAELPNLSKLMSKLESFGDLPAHILRNTKIYKVCKKISELENIPGDDIYLFQARCRLLWEQYSLILEQPEQEQSVPVAKLDTSDDEEFLEPPAMCLTQLTPEQCARIEEAANACNPPLDRGVVELMCMLPHLTKKYGTCDIQVVAGGRLNQPMDEYPEFDRGIYVGGPTIPPHMLRLTDWLSTSWGIALFVDTKTGEAVQLQDWKTSEDERFCTELEGKKRPIEELLQEWIDFFLNMKLVPSGGEQVYADEFRSMDYLKFKSLMQEYDWPTAFPLSQPDYARLIKQQKALDKSTYQRSQNESLNQKWSTFCQQWSASNGINFGDQSQETEKIKVLDECVRSALKYHTGKLEDRQYALAADVPLDKRYFGPLILHGSSHIGDTWRVDVTPAMIIERFKEVVTGISVDEDVLNMKAILDAAYERWELQQSGVNPIDFVDEEDDDETSDYVPSEEECEDEEEFESDEEDLEFDVVMLEEDVHNDVEEVRKRLEKFKVEAA